MSLANYHYGIPKHLEARIISLRAQGKAISKISATLKISHDNIIKFLKSKGKYDKLKAHPY